MRRELVAAALEDIRAELFSDVIYTPVGGAAVELDHAIYGVEVAASDDLAYAQHIRRGTHVAAAPVSLFPALQKGDLLQEGTLAAPLGPTYRVVDLKPGGDGRLEWAIALEAV